ADSSPLRRARDLARLSDKESRSAGVRMSGFYVHHPTVSKAGDDAGVTSAHVTSKAHGLNGTTPQTITAHTGWESSPALQECLNAWEARLKDLAYEVRTISQNLGKTTQAYQEAESKVLAHINLLASQLKDLKR